MIHAREQKGLALIELMVALIVMSIVVTAVVTLAYALETANDFSNDTGLAQAQIRFTALRISDLIRYSKLICYAGSDDLAVWRADDDNDGQISIGELVYIECGSAADHLQLCEFASTNNTPINLSLIGSFASNWWSAYSSGANYTEMIPECSNVQFYLDDVGTPTNCSFVTISYDIVENGVTRQCQINAKLRGRAGNLLDGSGGIVSDDD
jgi:prepilin-type N-terminal cleavage/methylation domain-containing protein